MKPILPIAVCAILAVAGCANGPSAPGAKATAAVPADLTPWLGSYYAGTISNVTNPTYSSRFIMNLVKGPTGGYMVHRCFSTSTSADSSATVPQHDMTCLPAPATQQGNVLRYTGNSGDTVTLTFSSPTSIAFHDVYLKGYIWQGTLDRTSPVPTTGS